MSGSISKSIISALVLSASLGVTFILWNETQQVVNVERQSQFDLKVAESVEHVEKRIHAYEEVLYGLRGLFDSSQSVSREEFYSYIRSLRLNDFYPGMQALGRFMREPATFDLIISDQSMPGMSGSEMVRQLRYLDFRVPIIIYTGYGDILSEETVHSLNIGMLLQKPASRPEILSAIMQLLQVPLE